MSVQEAAYHTLGLRLTNCSVSHVFVNTFPPEERTRKAKSKAALMEMDPDSDEVFEADMLNHYEERGKELESVCLADYATMYLYTNRSSRIPAQAIDKWMARRVT